MVAGDFSTETEVLVIGGGPAGYTAAIRCAQLGKEVTLVEQHRLGGVSLNRGCIPQQALLTATARAKQAESLAEMGVNVSGVAVDYGRMQEWKGRVVDSLVGSVAGLLESSGVTCMQAEAVFSGNGTARVITAYESGRYEFEAGVIATGTRPAPPDGVPKHPAIVTASQALALREVPENIALWGGGYVEVELATIYARLGAEVILLSPEARLLPDFEPSTVEVLVRELTELGVKIHLGVGDSEVRVEGGRALVGARVDGEEDEWAVEKLVLDGVYRPNVEELALPAAGVATEGRGFVQVDDRQRTTNPRIYAAGDVVGPPFLAHKGIYEAKVVAEAICGRPTGNDALAMPRVVYGEPELVGVGLTEEEARNAGHDVVVGRFPLGASGRALTLGAAEGVACVVAEGESQSVLGIHLVGSGASELAAEAALAVEMQAMLEDLALTIHPHPTLSEAVVGAAEAAMRLASHDPARQRVGRE